MSIACLTSVNQFRNLFEANNETSFLTNYYYSEATGMVADFKNILDFKKQRLLRSDSGTLSGCIQKNGNMGKIELLPFQITIKGLDQDYEFKNVFSTAQCAQLVGFFQSKAVKCPKNPSQLMDRLCKLFRKYLQRGTKAQFDVAGLIGPSYSAMSEGQIESLIQSEATK